MSNSVLANLKLFYLGVQLVQMGVVPDVCDYPPHCPHPHKKTFIKSERTVSSCDEASGCIVAKVDHIFD